MATAQTPKPETVTTGKTTDKNNAFEVIAKVDVFYRAGHEWTQVPKVIAKKDLTPEQISELESEPMLIVREVQLPKAAEPAEEVTA